MFDAVMRLNFFKVTALLLAIGSLLLPWLSTNLLLSDRVNFSYYLSYNSSPSLTHVMFIQFQNETLRTDESSLYYPPLFPANMIFHLITTIITGDGYHSGYILAEMTTGAHGFFVCFAVATLFATSIWKSYAKKIYQIGVCLLLSGIVLSLTSQIWLHKTSSESWVIASSAAASNFGIEDVFFVDSLVLGVGLFLALLSVFSFAASYLSPKFVSLPIDFDIKSLHKLKENWLAVPDKEKLPTLFLITYLSNSLAFLIILLLNVLK